MAGSNNFLVFNPTKANQESDGTYAADATRAGGIAFDQIMSSVLGNKLFYQTSIMAAALGQMLADKGYTVSDASLVSLETVLFNLLTQSDLPQLSILNAVTVANPVVSPGSSLINTTLNAGFVGTKRIFRVTTTVRCNTAPSAGATLDLNINGTNIGIAPANWFVQVGDFARMVVEIAVRTSGNVEVYAHVIGVSNAAQRTFSFQVTSIALGNLFASFTVATKLIGNGTGNFTNVFSFFESVGIVTQA